MSEQAPSPLQTQLVDELRACDRFEGSGRDRTLVLASPQEQAEALVPLVERLIAEAERRTLTQAADAIEGFRWPDTGAPGAYTYERACENEMLDRALAVLAGLAIGPPPQETRDA